MIALLIFISALFAFYKYSINLSDIQEVKIEELIIDGKTLSNSIISEGLPINWNTSNVIAIGLTDGNYRINKTKLGYFAALNYTTTKNLLSVMNNYYIFFEDKNGSSVAINGIEGIGKPGVTKTNLNTTENPNDIIKIFRFVMYNATILRMGIYVW